MYKPLRSWPRVSRNPRDILTLFGPSSSTVQKTLQNLLGKPGQPILGLDLEYNSDTGVPTILGVSDGVCNVSCSWSDGLPYLVLLLKNHARVVFVGHSFITADAPILEAHGVSVPLEQIEDTIVRFWLTNAHLAKSSKKSSLDDADEQRKGAGYMNLGTMLTSYTDLSNYKECRGAVCKGPCPEHDVFGYNGTDALGPVLALPGLLRHSHLRGVDKLYDMHRKLVYVTHKMHEYGVQVDVPYLKEMKREFEEDKKKIAASLPFNPDSPKQVIAYFKAKGIALDNAQEATIRETVDEYDDAELITLLEFKELGDGPDRWFGPKFLTAEGRVHPRIGIFTSSGRMNCVSPNLQNVSVRRINRKTGENVGLKTRRAIIASPGHYLIKADLGNAENRVVLHGAGYIIDREVDLHTWVAEIAGFTKDMDFVVANGGKPRQAAKSVQHAGNYLEGLQLKTPEEMRGKTILREIEAGARTVYPNWTFEGKIVSFTGANLAQRAFGDKSWANRKKALEIAERYFGRFEGVRKWQQQVTKACEVNKAVQTPLGYYTMSFGHAEERMKTAAAIHGSQPVAHITKLALIRLYDAFEKGSRIRPILQVHDEIVCEVPYGIPYKKACEFLQNAMEMELPELPGLIIPADPSYSIPGKGTPSNWRDMEEL